MKPRYLLVLMLAALGGCGSLPPGACDPNAADVSIFRKRQCDASGGYRDSVDRKEARLSAAQEENALFRESLAALEAQQASYKLPLQAQQQARDQVVSSTRRLLDQVKQKGSTDKKLQAQLKLAEKDLAELQAQPITASAGNAEIAARQRKAQELEQMVKRLRASVLQAP